MSITAVLLILLSAFTHAAWNFFSKQGKAGARFYFLANTAGVIYLFPVVLFFHRQLFSFPAAFFFLAVFSGLCEGVYYLCLGKAYQLGDLSIIYPLARSLPSLIVLLFSFSAEGGHNLSPLLAGGVLLILIGTYFLPRKNFRENTLKNYINPASFFALLTALGTAGYSILGDKALFLARSSDVVLPNPLALSLVYLFLEGLFACLWLGLYILIRGEQKGFAEFVRTNSKQAFLTGAGIFLTYSLVLTAMSFVKNVSYVVAFRQLSIPIGALLGVFILKEPAYTPKYAGIGLLLAGLVLVGIG